MRKAISSRQLMESVSNAYYNKGLALAKRNNLSGAITALSRSLSYNKLNSQARSLYGLLFYGTGQIGEALKQWVIGVNIDKTSVCSRYLDMLQSEVTAMEKMNDAVKMYNQSLKLCQNASEDLAIIQLKRAVETSPNFIEALNLMALCYLSQNNEQKAAALVKKVLAIDEGNQTALSYLRELSVEKISIVKNPPSEKSKSPSKQKKKSAKNGFAGNFLLLLDSYRSAACLAIGFLAAAILFGGILLPVVINIKNNDIVEVSSGYDSKIDDKSRELADTQAELASLEAELAKTTATLEEQERQADRVNTVYLAQAALNNKLNDEAADLILSIDITELPEQVREMAESVKNSVFPSIEARYYQQGYSLYNSKKYAEAKEIFLISLKYQSDNSTNSDNTLYYLGRIADIAGDTSAARTYYEAVIGGYPSSDVLSNAISRLEQLGGA